MHRHESVFSVFVVIVVTSNSTLWSLWNCNIVVFFATVFLCIAFAMSTAVLMSLCHG